MGCIMYCLEFIKFDVFNDSVKYGKILGEKFGNPDGSF